MDASVRTGAQAVATKADQLYDGFDKVRQEAVIQGATDELSGKIVGRVGFEVAALVVPAGLVAKGAKGAELAANAGRAVEGASIVTDAARAARTTSTVAETVTTAARTATPAQTAAATAKAAELAEAARTPSSLTRGADRALAHTGDDAGRVARLEAGAKATPVSETSKTISSAAQVAQTERTISGLRQPAGMILTNAEISVLTAEFAEIGGDVSKLRFNVGQRTGYIDDIDKINIRGDVMPLESATHPRSTMSTRAVLAHELGHQAHSGTKVPINAWNDEFRASYWAAKNVPNLSNAERADLINDAIMRAQEANVPIRHNDFMRSILYGY